MSAVNSLNILNNQIINDNILVKDNVQNNQVANVNHESDQKRESILTDLLGIDLSKIDFKIDLPKIDLSKLDLSKLDIKKMSNSLVGAVLGGALAYITFSAALIPIVFVCQLILSGGLPIRIPPEIVKILTSILELSIQSLKYLPPVAGAIAGAKNINKIAENVQNPANQAEISDQIDHLKIAFEKFKNSQSLDDHIINGFNLGTIWGKETNAKAGEIGSLPLALAMGAVMMAPLALLVASLLAGKMNIWLALGTGFLASLPLATKTFSAVKNFAKQAYSLIGGAISGVGGAAWGYISKLIKTIKEGYKEEEQKDEFQQNSPYKTLGLQHLFETGGKLTENFIKGTSDVLSFSSLINNILTRNPTGLGVISSIIAGTIKSFEGSSTLIQAAANNRPQDFNKGIFRLLTGLSLLFSFLAPLFGPMGILVSSLISLLFMALEKISSLKQDQNLQDNQNQNDEKVKQEKNEKLKKSFAIGVAIREFVSSLGSLGKFWMGWDSLFGGNYGGLTSIFGLIGSTRDILQGSKLMQLAVERSNLKIGIKGLMNVIGGICLGLAAIGMGKVFGIAAVVIELIKLMLA
ncbi:MAG: hypothetical protein ABDH21_05260 [bacterium]